MLRSIITIMCALTLATSAYAGAEDTLPLEDGRNMAAVREGLRQVTDRLQSAYEVLLQDDPEASGTVSLSFTITAEGRAEDIEVTCDSGLEDLEDTVVRATSELDFGSCPDQPEPIPVTVPFTLTPPAGD